MRMMKLNNFYTDGVWCNPSQVATVHHQPDLNVTEVTMSNDLEFESSGAPEEVLAEWHAAMNDEPVREDAKQVDSEYVSQLSPSAEAYWKGDRPLPLVIRAEHWGTTLLTREEACKIYKFLSRFVGGGA